VSTEKVLRLLSCIGTTKAQKTNNLNGTEEFVVEMGTQFLVSGKIKPFRNDFSDFDITQKDQEKLDIILNDANIKFNELFDELFKLSVGNFVIL
jgi:hypothetical protein